MKKNFYKVPDKNISPVIVIQIVVVFIYYVTLFSTKLWGDGVTTSSGRLIALSSNWYVN